MARFKVAAERWESNPIISYSAVSPIGTPSSMESIIRFRVPLLPAPTPCRGIAVIRHSANRARWLRSTV